MKRKVKLCNECHEMIDDYFPYLYPDGTNMSKDDLIVETVDDMLDCDNHENNLDRKPIWID